jgi:MoxR-like ATPase
MRKVIMNQQLFETKLFELFPDVQSSGTVSRQQIMSTMNALNTTKYPTWLMANKVGRGLYAIAGGNAVAKVVPLETIENDVRKPVYVTEAEVAAPLVDPAYVAWGNHSDLDKIITSRLFHPVYVTGPTGNGKSTMIEQICAKHKIPLIRVNLNSTDDEDKLIASKTLIDGNVVVEDGPMIVAMRRGIPILIDEIDAGSANLLMCLQGILEGKPYYIKAKNEIVYPQPGFNIFATANTKGKGSDDGRYIGTNVLNEAFLERFAVVFEQDYPSAKIETKIVTNLMQKFNCLDGEFAATLVKWADAIRRTFDDGGVDEVITTRRLVHIVKNFSIYRDKRKSVNLAINRFDPLTKDAFLDLFDKVSADPNAEVGPSQTPVSEQPVSEENSL